MYWNTKLERKCEDKVSIGMKMEMCKIIKGNVLLHTGKLSTKTNQF